MAGATSLQAVEWGIVAYLRIGLHRKEFLSLLTSSEIEFFGCSLVNKTFAFVVVSELTKSKLFYCCLDQKVEIIMVGVMLNKY